MAHVHKESRTEKLVDTFFNRFKSHNSAILSVIIALVIIIGLSVPGLIFWNWVLKSIKEMDTNFVSALLALFSTFAWMITAALAVAFLIISFGGNLYVYSMEIIILVTWALVSENKARSKGGEAHAHH